MRQRINQVMSVRGNKITNNPSNNSRAYCMFMYAANYRAANRHGIPYTINPLTGEKFYFTNKSEVAEAMHHGILIHYQPWNF